jgi:hypothetical protein
MAKHKHSIYLVTLLTLVILFGLVVILDGCNTVVTVEDMEEGEPVTVEDGEVIELEVGDLSGQAYSKTYSRICTDSDNGIKPFVSGVVNFKNKIFWDKKIKDKPNHVREFFCNKKGKIRKKDILCEHDIVFENKEILGKIRRIASCADQPIIQIRPDSLTGGAAGITEDNYWKGYEIVTQEKDNTAEVEFGCPDGKKVLGGGCSGMGGTGALVRSRPWTQANGWQCIYDGVKDKIIAYAICACVSEETCSVSLPEGSYETPKKIPLTKVDTPLITIPASVEEDEFVDCAELYGAEYECWYNNWESNCSGQASIKPIPSGKCEVKTGGFENYCVTCESYSDSCGDPLTFADPKLEQVVRDAINKPTGMILNADVQELKELIIHPPFDATDAEKTYDLSGIQCLDLNYLEFYGTYIPELGVIANLINLKELYIYYGSWTPNLNQLAGLINLEKLRLHEAKITPNLNDQKPYPELNLYPLVVMSKLKELDLSYVLAAVQDINYILDLDNLEKLDIRGNPYTEETCSVLVPALEAKGVIVLDQGTCP